MNEQYIAYRQTLLKDDVRLAIYRNSHLRVFHKIGALKFAQNSQENAYAGVSKVDSKLAHRYSPSNVSV